MTTATLETHDRYLADFEAGAARRAAEPGELARLRAEAFERFRELGFPTPRQEDWRFTNVGPIARTAFVRAEAETVEASWLAPYLYEGMPRAVFVDGHFSRELSDLTGLPAGVALGSLAEALSSGAEGSEELGRHASFADQAFVALNTALFADGAFLRVPRGVVIERPLLLLYVATSSGDQARASYPRTLLVAEEASQVTVVESYVGVGDGVSLTCPVTEIVAGPATVVDHYRLQQETLASYHMALQQLHCERAASFSSHALSFGAALARTDVRARLAGEGIDCTLNGLYLTRGRQHVDHHMWVEHAAPHCASHELYKGILEGRSRAVFNGLIHVHEGAQKTDAKQTNRNLLLSREALVNTNPQLLIFADDVKCTHGSTVGQLDADAVFYLRSRGIGEEAARSLLTYAFASEIVERIRVAPVRRDLEEFLFRRLPKGEIVRQAV
jgi:Fe-S cluster assembly protein SufD